MTKPSESRRIFENQSHRRLHDSSGSESFSEQPCNFKRFPYVPHNAEVHYADATLPHPAGYISSWMTTSMWNPILPHPASFQYSTEEVTSIYASNQVRSAYDHPPTATSFPSVGIPCNSAMTIPPRPIYPVAHQPIPPEKRSAYSELAINLDFMKKLQLQDQRSRTSSSSTSPLSLPSSPMPTPLSPSSISKDRIPEQSVDALSSSPHSVPYKDQHEDDGLASPTLTSLKFVPSATTYIAVSPAIIPSESPPPITGPIRNHKEPRRPSLACTFCRERKIACGRPPGGSPDPTCNQCVRRSFKCEYVKEQRSSRRR